MHAKDLDLKKSDKTFSTNKRRQIIYVVDDDASVCRALKLLLEPYGFKVATFTGAAEFLSLKRFYKAPSCLLLDVIMPRMSGLTLQEVMADKQLTIPIVFITSYGGIPMAVKAIQAGAIDFLPKPFTEKKLLNAIERAIVKDKIQIKEQVEIARIKEHIKTLSSSELEVFRCVAKGMLNKQIASKRGNALQTIKVHRVRVMHKMHARNVTQLIHLAQKAGITSPQYEFPLNYSKR